MPTSAEGRQAWAAAGGELFSVTLYFFLTKPQTRWRNLSVLNVCAG